MRGAADACTCSQGRPGEWTDLTVAQVEELIRVKGYCLICLYHKTFTTYGEAGKYVPPALLKVFELYLGLRKLIPEEELDKESFYLTGPPQVHKLLQEFGPFIGLTLLLICPTFLRKFQVTSVGELACQPT